MKRRLQTGREVLRDLGLSDGEFTPLSSEDWEDIGSSTPSLSYPSATELFRQGSWACEVYLIDAGLVKLTRSEQDGCEIIVSLRFPGWVLGAASVIAHKPHPVSAITAASCYLRRIPGEVFTELLKKNSQLSWHLHQMHSHEVFQHVARVTQIKCLPARQRFEQFLRQLISALGLSKSQKEIQIQLPLKHWEIAELIAVTPEHLSRMLKHMQREGVIQRKKGWIILSDPSALQKV